MPQLARGLSPNQDGCLPASIPPAPGAHGQRYLFSLRTQEGKNAPFCAGEHRLQYLTLLIEAGKMSPPFPKYTKTLRTSENKRKKKRKSCSVCTEQVHTPAQLPPRHKKPPSAREQLGIKTEPRSCDRSGVQTTDLASLTLSLSSFPHCQSFPGSTAKCTGSSLCSESVRGITAAGGGEQKAHLVPELRRFGTLRRGDSACHFCAASPISRLNCS